MCCFNFLVASIGLQPSPSSTTEMSTTLSVCIAINNGVVLDIPISVNFEAVSGTATCKTILFISFQHSARYYKS